MNRKPHLGYRDGQWFCRVEFGYYNPMAAYFWGATPQEAYAQIPEGW